MGLWILLLIALAVEVIRDRRQLLVVFPFLLSYAVVGLEFLLSGTFPSVRPILTELTYGLIPFWTLVWLWLPRASRTKLGRARLFFRLALCAFLVASLGHLDAGSVDFRWHTYALCLAFVVAMCTAHQICREKYSPWRMTVYVLVVMMVGGCIGLMVSDLLQLQYRYWGLPFRTVFAIAIDWPPPQTLWGVCIVPALVPFMLLTYRSTFHRERFERVLRLNTPEEPDPVDTS